MLRDRDFELGVSEVGNIDVERGLEVRNRPLRYALFHRPSQKTLKLG